MRQPEHAKCDANEKRVYIPALPVCCKSYDKDDDTQDKIDDNDRIGNKRHFSFTPNQSISIAHIKYIPQIYGVVPRVFHPYIPDPGTTSYPHPYNR
jgi:hypothetical protein